MSKSESQVVYTKTAIIVGIALLLAVGWFYWAVVFNSKQNIFESMLANSLTTTGVTKKLTQESQNGTLEQLYQSQFGSKNLVEVKTTITQREDDSKTKVVTRTIATPTENYSMYEEISTPPSENSPNFDSVKNVWGVQLSEEGGGTIFSDSVFGVVLFGNLPINKRDDMVNFMQDKLVYTPNYDKVESSNVDGKDAYVYDVSINTKSYVELIQKYDDLLGLKLFKDLNSDDYEQSQPIKVKLSVDKRSRQLLKVEYDDGRIEGLSGYGIRKDIHVPDNSISRTELESRLQATLQ